VARRKGITPVILSDSIEGESRDVALVHAAIAREVLAKDRPFAKPVVILSGGETTVTLRAKGGRGGRNGEFAWPWRWRSKDDTRSGGRYRHRWLRNNAFVDGKNRTSQPALIPAVCSMATTATAALRRSATCLRQARPEPTSTTSGLS
jgi:hypothetical protein